MKLRKVLAVRLALVLAMTALCGCGGNGSESDEQQGTAGGEAAIAVTDMMGREIRMDKPAEKVVALTASDCEIIYALGAENTLVGRGEYCNYPAEVTEVPVVASGSETNLEQIMALMPDVVIMNKMDQPKEQVEALENAGIRVVMNDADDIGETYQSIELIGAIVDKNEEAAALVRSMKDTFAKMSAEPLDTMERTVYFEVSPLEYGLWTAGEHSFMHEVAAMMGLTNIFGEVDDWAQVSEEQVLERDPDYIVTVAMFYGEGPTPVEEIKSRPGWENLTAVKNDKILNLQNDELSRPGPRLVDGAKLLYEMVYGKTIE